VSSRVGRFFASPRLAIVLIGVLLAMGVVSFLVPQRSHADLTAYDRWKAESPGAAALARALGADDVFASLPFYLVAALLAANLTTCTLRRMRRRGAAVRVPTSPPAGAVSLDLPSDPAAIAAAARRNARLWVPREAHAEDRRYLLLDREILARAGSLVMHAGLLLVIVAAVFSGLTRFQGVMALTEGQTLRDEPASYLVPPSLPALGAAYSGDAIKLQSVTTDYEGSSVVQSHALLTFTDARGTSVSRSVQVNQPAVFGTKDYLVLKGGHAAHFSASDGAKTLFEDGVVRLGKPVSGGYDDSVTLADGRRLGVTTNANGAKPEVAAAQRLNLADPVAHFSLEGTPGSLTLRPGESGSLGGVVITLSDVRLWNEFAVRQDLATPAMYLAFALVTLGAAVRFGFGKRRVGLLVEPAEKGSRAYVWGDSVAAERLRARLAEALGEERVGA
jgi:cytochrome c biogenesis protein ResB